MDIRNIALELLQDCFEDEINMLKLRIIRDNQEPRFKALWETSVILEEFNKARNVHTSLKKNRDLRVEKLKYIIENFRG